MDWYFNCRIKNEIITSDAQAFENLFCSVMKAADDDFQKVKASGRNGDQKCDGFNSITGDYYCIYAPEDFKKEYTIQNGLSKIKEDILGIVKNWKHIKTINYVINDKFVGLPPAIQQCLIELENNKELPEIKRFSMEKLKEIALKLSLEKKQEIFGFVPDLTNSVSTLQFSIVEDTIKYLERNVSIVSSDPKLTVPDFLEKIKFNNLSENIKDQLNAARHQIYMVEEFFENNSIYKKEELRNFCNGLYLEACNVIDESVENYSDRRFIYILQKMTYKKSKAVIDNVLIIMATFFESCDIFEEPVVGGVV